MRASWRERAVSKAPRFNLTACAIFREEAPFLAGRQDDWLLPALAEFEQASTPLRSFVGYCTGPKQVSRREVAAAERMVRDHLLRAPIERFGTALRKSDSFLASLPHPLRPQPHLKINRISAM